MTAELTDYRQQIVVAHAAASGALRDAVTHAVRAGELLVQAKAALPHGSFGAFCAALPFGATTARGYMRLAALDPANRQRVADMPLRTALLATAVKRKPEPVQSLPGFDPRWVPAAAHWSTACTDSAAFWVVPSLEHAGYFHITKFYELESESYWEGTKRPMLACAVEGFLQYIGLAEPWAAE